MIELTSFYLVLLFVSTILSMSEVSILTINSKTLDRLISEKPKLTFFKKKRDKAALDLMTINFTWDTLGAMLLSHLINEQFYGNTTHILIASFVTTLITLKIATLSAKMFASKKSDFVIKYFGRCIIFFYYALKPLSFLLSSSVMFVMRGFLKKHDNEDKITDAELLSVLSMAKKEGLIEDKPHELILNLINLQDKKINELIKNKEDFEFVDIESSLLIFNDKIMSGEIKNKCVIVTKKHENHLYPVGVLTFKDIAQNNLLYASGAINDLPSIASVMHPCITTKQDEKASELISKLDKEDHIVVVVNDFGIIKGVLESDDIIKNAVSSS